VSFSLDVNVLLYASDVASPQNEPAQRFLSWAVSGHDLLCLGWPTIASYLRIATHPGIFAAPLTPKDALANVEALAGRSHVRLLAEEPGFLEVYRDVTAPFPVRGNLVPDAHLAALLKQHGVRTLYTRDADFRKFAFLDLRDPFAATNLPRG
jgi:toxin-antitoxin system PIN domain toxin